MPLSRSNAFPVTILDTEDETLPLNLDSLLLVGVQTDEDFDGATLTFHAQGAPGGDFVPVVDADGAAVAITVGAEEFVLVPPAAYAGLSAAASVKIVSSASQSSGDTELILVCRTA